MTADAVGAFAARWGFAPDSPLLRAALTHRSAAATLGEASERLEFLGDALLGGIVARLLVEGFSADTEEGVLTRARIAVIRRETLAEAGRRLGLDALLVVGENERRERRHTQDGLLAEAYEAVLGALALERGDPAARAFVLDTLGAQIDAVLRDPPQADPKNLLQERVQGAGGETPAYRVTLHETDGRQHHRFVAEALVAGRVWGVGEGSSRRQAERAAARAALEALESGQSPDRET